uniref:Inhibitor I9 domain-containing protein n=1 Tax=Oryza rufipogon TaxID=4529 RepID=A0A0E0RH75_ORYRU
MPPPPLVESRGGFTRNQNQIKLHSPKSKRDHGMLATILGSEQAAIDSILYSYRHGFSGFAAVLTYGKVARLSGELAAFPDGHLAAAIVNLARAEGWRRRCVTATHEQETDGGGGDDTTTCVQERATAAGSGDADARSNTAEIDGASAAQIDRAAEVRGLIDHDSRSNFADDAMKDQATAHHQHIISSI